MYKLGAVDRMILAIISGVALCALGVWMVIQAKKMDFERTNSSGVMEFDSFGNSYKHELKTRGLRMAGGALIFVGLIVFTFSTMALMIANN